MAVRPSLPARFLLPSGLRAGFRDGAARKAAQALSIQNRSASLAEQISVLRAPGVLVDESGAPLFAMRLALRDVHVLRAFLLWASVLPEEEFLYVCSNCGAPFSASPSALFEPSPFVDGELSDPEFDAPFDFDAWYPIEPVRVGRRMASRVRLADRTLEEAFALVPCEGRMPARITPAFVLAMGIRALGGERRLSAMAEALSQAGPRARDALIDVWLLAHYSPRLWGTHRCAKCGARNDLRLPLAREFVGRDVAGEEARASFGTREGPFPDLDAFEAQVRKAARVVYRRRGVRNVDLVVDDGVPAVDESGEPLLGCYSPGTPVDMDFEIPKRPEIRIFYRTFQAEYQRDWRFDIEDEIEETLDHELTHHLHQLSGDDPLGDEEDAEIEMEHMRVVGQKEARRRLLRQAADDFWGFLKATWVLWAVLLGLSMLMWCGRA